VVTLAALARAVGGSFGARGSIKLAQGCASIGYSVVPVAVRVQPELGVIRICPVVAAVGVGRILGDVNSSVGKSKRSSRGDALFFGIDERI
jgi:hypothetical protein